MPNSPNFLVRSCWSKAGLGTSIVLEFSPRPTKQQQQQQQQSGQNSKPGPCIALDLGATPSYGESVRAGTVLLTHPHLDHVGAIFAHARAYSLSHGGAAPTYYAPAEAIPLLENARDAMSALDGSVLCDDETTDDGIPIRRSKPLAMNFVGVAPGDEVVFSHLKHTGGVRVFARVARVRHAGCPAVGYAIGTRHAPRLKPEYEGASPEEIRAAVARGVSVRTEPRDVLEVAYTGDTSVDTFRTANGAPMAEGGAAAVAEKNALHLRQFRQCPLVFCESTFLAEGEEELARSRGHMHLRDAVSELILKDESAADSGQHVVLMHISARYDADRILDHLVAAIPREHWWRCHVAIAAHANSTHKWNHLVRRNGCLVLSQYMKWNAKRDEPGKIEA